MSHELVDSQDRGTVPICLTNEISVELPSPGIGHILLFIVFRPNRVVNVVPDFMKQNMAEDNIPHERDTKRKGHCLKCGDQFIHSKLNVRQASARTWTISPQHSRLIVFAFAGPDPPHAILAGKGDVIRKHNAIQALQVLDWDRPQEFVNNRSRVKGRRVVSICFVNPDLDVGQASSRLASK
jgi:hypothetical protein